MPSITFGYDPKDSIITNNGIYLNGTNPIINLATGEIIGIIAFNYYSQRLWDANGNVKYFNTLVYNILLNKLQNSNTIQKNSLDATVYFESDIPFERTPPGTEFETKITSSTIPVSPDAKLKYIVTQSAFRIYELDF